MTIFLAANNAASQLAAPIDAVQTTITLATGTGALFPSPTGSQVFAVTVVDAGTGLLREVMYCTSRTADVLTIVRGREGTTAQAFTIYDPVANLFTKGTFENLAQNPSSATGTVAAVAGAGTIVPDNLPVFSDANGTLADSGVSFDDIIFNAGGGTSTTSAVSFALTNTSPRVQVITMTATNKTVKLPSALTINSGGPIFVIRNPGANGFYIKDNAGNIITYIRRYSVIAFYCTDTTTAAGNWTVGNENPNSAALPFIVAGVIAAVNSVSSLSASCALMSTDRVICGYRDTATGFAAAIMLNISEAEITPGTALQIAASLVNNRVSIVRMTNIQALCTYNTAGGQGYAVALNVPVSTITAGTPFAYTPSTATLYNNLTALDATRAIGVWQANTGVATAMVLSIASSVVTGGAAFAANAVTATYCAICTLTSSKAMFSWVASGVLNARVLDAAATTITGGNTDTWGGDATDTMLATLTATQVIAVYVESGAVNSIILNVSTSTTSHGTVVPVIAAGSNPSVAILSTTRAMVTYDVTTTQYAAVLDIASSLPALPYPAEVIVPSGGISQGMKGCAVGLSSNTAISMHIIPSTLFLRSLVATVPTNF